MNEFITAAATREHIRDMRARADRYRMIAEARSRARRLDRADRTATER